MRARGDANVATRTTVNQRAVANRLAVYTWQHQLHCGSIEARQPLFTCYIYMPKVTECNCMASFTFQPARSPTPASETLVIHDRQQERTTLESTRTSTRTSSCDSATLWRASKLLHVARKLRKPTSEQSCISYSTLHMAGVHGTSACSRHSSRISLLLYLEKNLPCRAR